MQLTNIERKAIRLVAERKVHIVKDDGTHIEGFVVGDTGTYSTSVDPDGHHCDCEYGEHRDGARHSHTIALTLQAEAERQGWKPEEDQ